MTDHVMGGDLYALWRVSDVHLPRITAVYYDANRTVALSDSAGMAPAVAASWTELRTELTRMYAQIGETIDTAAVSLRQATQAFIDTDQANAQALSKYMSDSANHDYGNPASNPPQPGDNDYPAEPVTP
jgi:hypothetical protein